MTTREPIIPAGHEAAEERFQIAPAFRVGDTVHVAGVIGRDADGYVPDDAETEYAAAFRELAGARLDVKATAVLRSDRP